MKIGVVSLGCDKNRIDSENMLAYLQDDGYELTGDPSLAEIIIVNTCGFIDSAKQEAIDTVLEMSEYKKGKCKYLIVTGCLPQRYMSDMADGFPEVDMFWVLLIIIFCPNLLKIWLQAEVSARIQTIRT